jgi:hypothetical protein
MIVAHVKAVVAFATYRFGPTSPANGTILELEVIAGA